MCGVVNPPNIKLTTGTVDFNKVLASGMMAGAGSAVLSTPIDVVKTRLQVEGAKHTSAIAQFKDIAKNEGGATQCSLKLPVPWSAVSKCRPFL